MRIQGKVVRQPFECDWDAGERINPHHIRASAVLQGGGRISSTVQTKGLDIAEEVDVDVVQVTAVVTDGDGRFVKGLKESDFEEMAAAGVRAICCRS